MAEFKLLVDWLRARLDQRDEDGFTAVEWLLVALGVNGIATLAVAAVQSYVTGQTNKLGAP